MAPVFLGSVTDDRKSYLLPAY